MADVIGELKVKTGMDTSEVEKGYNKVDALMEGSKRKSKETNTFYERSNVLLKDLAKSAKLFGLGIVGALTGAVSASPHFKAFTASMKGPWMKLTQFLGREFKPTLDKISDAFKGFVSWFTASEGIKKTLGFLEKFMSNTIKLAIDWGGTLGGWLFGTKDTTGVIPWLIEEGGAIQKTLGISADTSTLFILAGLAAAFKMPHLALALTGLAAAQVIKETTESSRDLKGALQKSGRSGGGNLSDDAANLVGMGNLISGGLSLTEKVTLLGFNADTVVKAIKLQINLNTPWGSGNHEIPVRDGTYDIS